MTYENNEPSVHTKDPQLLSFFFFLKFNGSYIYFGDMLFLFLLISLPGFDTAELLNFISVYF